MTPVGEPHRPGSPEARAAERRRLIRFAERSVLPDGAFAWLDDLGRPDEARPLHLWINARMTHVFGLEAIHSGSQDARVRAQGGIRVLSERFEDGDNGGWFEAIGADDAPVDATKAAYGHAFVLLAAATGVAAGIDGALTLLDRALSVLAERFWEPDAGTVRERFLRPDWRDEESYRGANANMHTVEALLTASSALREPELAQMALAIAEKVIHGAAREAGWRVVEHFDAAWTPLPEFNSNNRADHFRPYGLTIGHWVEWSRLLIAIEAAIDEPPAWLIEGATALFANGYRVGWSNSDLVGAPYTVDWQDHPVVEARLSWVAAEAALAADALARRTSDDVAGRALPRLWDEIDRYFIDRERGAWHSELDSLGRPATTIWSGKPDVYHAYQACLFPDLTLGLGRGTTGLS